MSDSRDKKLEWTDGDTLTSDDYKVFKVERKTSQHLSSNRKGVFSIIHSLDWVNILAFTPSNQAVLIRQYRHGSGTVVTEIPGGMVDEGERPLNAAQRELREETGFTARTWVHLGTTQPNPAIQNNYCHMFLALDAEQTSPKALDDNEVIDTFTVPIEKLPSLVYEGEIRHALILACFNYFTQLAGGWQRPTQIEIEAWQPNVNLKVTS